MTDMRVAVVGAGSWGTALAFVLAEKGPVTLWCFEPEVATSINQHHKNPHFLSDFLLPDTIRAETDLETVVRQHDLLVMVIPTQFTRAILARMAPHLPPDTLIVSASKGIEVAGPTLLSDIYREIMGETWVSRQYYCLSGPSFAREVMQRQPTAVAIAGGGEDNLARIQKLFHTAWFRAYVNDDRLGVELGGALKNVIALAAGISDGLGFGHNARAALLTRGLAEMARLGVRLGARVETFAGLAGMGDLLLTATSDLSRNRTVGKRLGAGESLEAIQQGQREVAEGVKTVQAVQPLALRLGVEMPITQAVHDILYQGRDPRSVVAALMERSPRGERD